MRNLALDQIHAIEQRKQWVRDTALSLIMSGRVHPQATDVALTVAGRLYDQAGAPPPLDGAGGTKPTT